VLRRFCRWLSRLCLDATKGSDAASTCHGKTPLPARSAEAATIRPSQNGRSKVKEAQIEPRKAKEELRPFYTIFGTDQRAIDFRSFC